MMDKHIIKRNFSRYAQHYDQYCAIQNLCAVRLAKMASANGVRKILDVGCGTGNYTKLLRDRYPAARIWAIDISQKMVAIAKEKLKGRTVELIVADGEMLNLGEHFDFITSNACFQWFEDLEKTLSKYRELLNEKGGISFSTFGPLTFYELNKSLNELLKESVSLNSCHFLAQEKIKEILTALFKEIEIERLTYQEKYDSLRELLKKIKFSGTGGSGVYKKVSWTSRLVDKLEKIYRDKFTEIVVTYEVFFCEGVR